ncbi:MAG: hypothetical protein HS113_04855 [Verrucomicrobiales bacterium]|nr:hypothetical protein [Verrucomicrobiales bacterium]
MAEKPTSTRKRSDKSTKQELLDTYQTLTKELAEKRAAELNPERQLQERKAEEALKTASALAPEGIDREIGSLKSDIGRMLAELSEKLAAEAARFKNLQQAVEAKERELQELYGIEKTAATLAALIETQNQKRAEFEIEMTKDREELTAEIQDARIEWDKERKAHEAELRERDAAEKKARDREKEQFDYAFKRDQQAVRDKLADEKATLEKELKLRKETAEKDFAERERVLVERETELATLRTRAAAFPQELEAAVAKAVQATTERLQLEAKNREGLLMKQFEGERNVLLTRNEALEKGTKELADQNARLSKQIDAAYLKLQEIAEKTIEGASQSKLTAELQKLLAEQGRRPMTEK